MFQEELRLTYGEGRYLINIVAVVTLDGVSITLTGGEKPHVGAMAISVPRFGDGDKKIACDTWITPRAGHKDDQAAALIARQICLATGQTTAVTAGIHIDQALASEIELLMENSRQAACLIAIKINEIMENKKNA